MKTDLEIDSPPTRFRIWRTERRELMARIGDSCHEIVRVPSKREKRRRAKDTEQEEALYNVNNNFAGQSRFGSHGAFTTDEPRAA